MVGPRSEVSEQYKHSPASAVLLTVDLSAPERGAIEAKVDGDAPVVGGDGKLQGELQMVFAEGYGEKGVLIVLSATGFGERVAMIHDLATNKWHKQTYTPIPTFTNSSILDCAIAVAAPDRSSLNIYTYVHNPDTSNPGWNTTSMHILTLPSFEWINVPPQPRSMSDGSPIPGGGKCFKVPGEPRQMGVFGGGGGGGRRGEQGCLPKGELVRVFDLTKLEWINSKPKTKGEEYEVPEPVYKAIGGDSSGHATRTEPAGGFTEPTLAAIFASQRTPSTSGSFSAVPTENSTLGYPRQHSTLPPANLGWILLAIFGGIVLMTAAWVAFRHRDELKGGDVKEKLTDDMEMNIVVQPKGAEESVPLASAGANNGQAQAARTP
ncbi:hypothetical protein DFH27DRAFT_384916 [Peziza echinospora]|nr:hypothetical protein DFH27DRAFT_384916 [Peziza echinospora]